MPRKEITQNESGQLTAVVADFKRKKTGEWEKGVAISQFSGGDYDIFGIVDKNGVMLKMVWEYRLQAYYGCFTIRVPATVIPGRRNTSDGWPAGLPKKEKK